MSNTKATKFPISTSSESKYKEKNLRFILFLAFAVLLLVLLSILILIFRLQSPFRVETKNPESDHTVMEEPSDSHLDNNSPEEKKVLIIDFDPIIEAEENKRLSLVKNWNNSRQLTEQYITDIKEVSGGYVNYVIEDYQKLDKFPVKKDGFQYTDIEYLSCLRDTTLCHQPDAVDYNKIVEDTQACEKRNYGVIDELWLFGGPYFGYWESTLAGPNTFFYNSPPLQGTKCIKQLPIMGFNYERGVSEMLENLGHRVESVMTHLYGPNEDTVWNNFTLLDKDVPGKAACGTIHFAPNSIKDYDWANIRVVSSTCNDWLNFPNLKGGRQGLNCSQWQCDGYGYKKWWLNHVPKAKGKTEGKWNNWWKYVLDYENSID